MVTDCVTDPPRCFCDSLWKVKHQTIHHRFKILKNTKIDKKIVNRIGDRIGDRIGHYSVKSE